MFLFDPSRNVEFYQHFAESRGADITHTFETHLQADYISGSPLIAKETGATFVAHDGDYGSAIHEYRSLIDGESFDFSNEGGPSTLCIHSPGHTPGSTSYVIGEKYLISGDTVFIVSVGRPDLGNQVVEWAKMLYGTIKERISILPDSLLVLPGHYTDWSAEADSEMRIINDFGTIKRNNEEIYGIDDIDDFVSFIQSNMRQQPEIYGQIRKVNSGHLTPCNDEQNVMDLGKNECAASNHTS
jgi:glyoxylase-like metal-dependent hydrolase (beta-lactamase superfamily II)